MRVQFCGANRTVTGSCHLIEVNGRRLVLDMGLYQGPRREARQINEWLPDDVTSADAVILSHGHLDHCGKLPVLTRAGYGGPIYCTPGTADVARIVLEDSAQIQEEDADYLNRRSRDPGEPPVKPLYVPSDIPPLMRLVKRVRYGQRTDLGNDVGFTFFDAGHILGSAYVLIDWSENGAKRTLLFTADIGRYHTPILADPHPLQGPADYVITESTYGGRTHVPIADVGPQLLDAVKEVIRRRSRLLVPAFAVGRTQTILWYLAKFTAEGQIPAIPIYVDSPMGVEVSQVYGNHRDAYDAETEQLVEKLRQVGRLKITLASSRRESQKINGDRGPCVIVASSPSCEFGRILHHLKVSVENPQDIVVFTGWIPPGTLGRRLQNGQQRIRILDRWYERRCEVRTLHGLSAHADGDELLRFLAPTLTPGTRAYVVHAEADQAEIFARRLLEHGIGDVTVPATESVVLAGA